jgi:hypothetical protein
MSRLGSVATAIVLICCAAAPAKALIIGAPGDSSNCIPFGCITAPNIWGPEYQQVYAASDFPAAFTITDLRFYHTDFAGLTNALDGGTFTISLSTTSAAVNGLNSANLAANLGADNKVVFSGSLPSSVPFGSFFDIFVSPFDYDPSKGNLLLDVTGSNLTQGQFSLFLDDDINGGGLFSRITSPNFASPSGLVTGFDEAVPEPQSFTLLAFGLISLGFARRRGRGA